MKLTTIKLFLSDLDGTHQTSHGDEKGANFLPDRHAVSVCVPGYDNLTVEETWPFVGKTHRVFRGGLIQLAARKHLGREFDEAELEELLKTYEKAKTGYLNDNPQVIKSRPGYDDVIHHIYNAGTKSGIVSHSQQHKIDFALLQMGTDQIFTGFALERFPGCPPKPKTDFWDNARNVLAPGVSPRETLIADDDAENALFAAANGYNVIFCPEIPRHAESESAKKLLRFSTAQVLIMGRNEPFNLGRIKRTFNFARTPAPPVGYVARPGC